MSKTRITIIGCGNLGIALGLALRTVIKDAEIIGHDKDGSAAKKAEALKAVDRTQWNLPSSVEGAQLVLLAIPQDGLEATLKAITQDVAAGAIVSDLCPVKNTALKFANLLPHATVTCGCTEQLQKVKQNKKQSIWSSISCVSLSSVV